MKKIFFCASLLTALSLFIGCTDEKCYVCTISGGVSATHCEGDFASATELEVYIEVLEASGASCNVQ